MSDDDTRDANTRDKDTRGDETRVDRILRWFKNNPVFAILLFSVVVIIGASQLVEAIKTLVDAEKNVQTSAASPADHRNSVTIVAEYGGNGSGPGYFHDARYLTIYRNREVVIAEYGGRARIQRLSLIGEPIAEWFMANDPMRNYFIFGLVDDGRSSLYVAYDNLLLKRDLATGRPLGEITVANCDPWIDAVGMQTTGPIAICGSSLAFERVGSSYKGTTIKLPFKRDTELMLLSKLAVDGEDNVYFVDGGECYIYKLAPDGTFLTRFAGEGNDPGSLHFPHAIAVDGSGMVYVDDSNGIEVFASDGRFLRRFTLPPTLPGIRDMAFDRKHDLYAIYDDAKLRVLQLPAL